MSVQIHRVLVVEDDSDIRESIMDALEDSGYEPMGAANGQAALDLLWEPGPRPCLILLDLMMPVMDGDTFRRRLLEIPELSDIPVVVLSAYRDVETKVAGLAVAGFLTKPMSRAALIAQARQFCPA
jgi:DNA-binding response OmpR family regulator